MASNYDDHPLGLLSELARRELVHFLESVPGRKELVVDSSLLRPLDRVASMSLLKEHEVLGVLPLRKNATLPNTSDVSRLYLTRACVAMTKEICRLICSDPEKNKAIIWVDRQLAACSRELELQGVLGTVIEFEWALPFVPVESDLFSLEIPIEVTATPTGDLWSAANAIWQFQSLYGQIPTIYGIGARADKAWKILKRLYQEKGEPRASPDQPVSHLFVVDRSIDRASIYLTALTYESLLHDHFGISCGKVTFGADVEAKTQNRSKEKPAEAPEAPKKPRLVLLDNNDAVFSAVRNNHMSAVFPFLSAKAKELRGFYDQGANFDKVSAMKDYISNELKQYKQQHRQLEVHIAACEVVLERTAAEGTSSRIELEHALIAGVADLAQVMDYAENCILMDNSPWQVLLFVCLASVTNNGLPPKLFNSFKDQFIAAYGIDYIPPLHFLAERGLITLRSPLQTANNFGQSLAGGHGSNASLPFLIKRLSLAPSSSDERKTGFQNPQKMSYVFSGAYTPAICQVVADVMMHGFNINELKKTFNGQVFAEENSCVPAERKPDNRMRKAIMVFFCGGVTYGEVAALRLLAHLNSFRILIATTNIIRREDYLKAMCNVSLTE
ncbi:unnamed protein product, partial [Mesorhabditis spiculigera]